MLPSGVVTFLFTDVVGSTRLWESEPDVMGPAMVRHDELVEAAVAGAGGMLVRPRGEGDSRFAVFVSPRDAVVAAAALAEALRAEPWPTSVPVRVRTALHTGEADLRAGDYYGDAVNRCARLRAVAHPGQTLLSATTAGLVTSRLRAGVSVSDLGEHRLKDLTRSEHVFQLNAQEPPAQFPPLLSVVDADTALLAPASLPALLDVTVGREQDLQELQALVGDPVNRLVTITGAGGVGKTRLCTELGHRLQSAFRDGVTFVALGQAVKADDFVAVVCAALGVRAGADPVASLTTALENRDALLILDNFEHILGAAPVVLAMLGAAPQLRVLTTSRQPLGLRGEALCPIAPLELTDRDTGLSAAAVLLLARVRAIDPRFTPSENDRADLEEIARRCDGLPLALELAAARTRMLSLGELKNRLATPLSELAARGGSDLPERHRTLRANIAWSVDALDAELQHFLFALTVFRGGFTVEAAAAAASVDEPVAWTRLEALLEHSLLHRSTAPGVGSRFHLLDTIAEYGDELLQPDTAEQVQRNHAQYYRSWLHPPPYAGRSSASIEEWLAQLAELSNLRQAVHWSLSGDDGELAADLITACAAIWDQTGPVTEIQEWLARLLARPDISEGRRCDAQTWQAVNLMDTNPRLAIERLHATVLIARTLNDTRREALLLMDLASAHFGVDTGNAYKWARAAQALAKSHPDAISLHISVLGNLGTATAFNGQLREGLRHIESANELCRTHRRDMQRLTTLNNLCEILLTLDEPDKAFAAAEEGLVLATRSQARELIPDLLSQRGYAAFLLGQQETAVLDLCRSAEFYVQLGKPVVAVDALIRLAAVVAARDPAAATAMAAVAATEPDMDALLWAKIRQRYLADLPDRLHDEYDEYDTIVERWTALTTREGTAVAVRTLIDATLAKTSG